MNIKIMSLVLTVVALPTLTFAEKILVSDPKPSIDVVFALDSTGSMGGLIEGAKQKIWSIANSVIATKPTPKVRVGLIAYRDRGDDYVTKLYDLTDDIDTVFRNLQSFQAGGGGDGPESVNQALHEAVHKMSWLKEGGATKIIFLVGDAPPHMDYANDTKYSVTSKDAVKQNIIINTVQCGALGETTPIWQEIAKLSEGSYVALAQTGNMTVVSTPFDGEISRLSAELGTTVVTYGKDEEQASVRRKLSYAAEAAPAAAADRAAYGLATGGKAIQGRGDLLADLEEKKTDLSKLKKEELPPEMQKMSSEEQREYLSKKQEKRAELNKKLEEISRKRSDYVAKENKRLAATGKGDSFDAKVSEIIAQQSKRKR